MDGIAVLRRNKAHRMLLYEIPRLKRDMLGFPKGYPAYDRKKAALDAAWERFDALMAGPPDKKDWHEF